MKHSRRTFLKVVGSSAATLILPRLGVAGELVPSKKTHLVTLSFDDGFKKSFTRIAEMLVFNTHGLDDEGWGPIRASYLEGLLERLLAIDTVEILPSGRALAKYAT